jgi:hypothetical protein
MARIVQRRSRGLRLSMLITFHVGRGVVLA